MLGYKHNTYYCVILINYEFYETLQYNILLNSLAHSNLSQVRINCDESALFSSFIDNAVSKKNI